VGATQHGGGKKINLSTKNKKGLAGIQKLYKRGGAQGRDDSKKNNNGEGKEERAKCGHHRRSNDWREGGLTTIGRPGENPSV